MTEITEEELSKEINKILENADLAKTTTKKVRQKLEKIFGTDLTDKKKLIDKLVMDYMNNKESDGDSEEDEDEVVEKKPTPKKRSAPQHSEEDSTEEDSGSDYEAPKRTRKAKQAKKSPKGKKSGGGGGKKGTGFTRTYKLSPALAELMGQDEMPRHEVVKRIWAMVKEKNLYDPNNKQYAVCDKAMHKVFGVKKFRTFGMMKHLKNHFLD